MVKLVEESDCKTRGFPNSIIVENEDGEWMLFTPFMKINRDLVEKRGKLFAEKEEEMRMHHDAEVFGKV